jgi:hypothetical protein
MASETPQQKHYSPAEPRSSPRSASARQARDPAGDEQVGPLALERLRKDDGRALLLYELRAPRR